MPHPLARTTLNRRSILGLGAAALTTTALAGCGGGEEPTVDTEGGAAPKATAGTLDNDGILVVGGNLGTANVFPENFNVYGGGEAAQGNTLFYETLFRISSTDGAALVPNLAESVEYTEEGKVATYTLRTDVTWSDGEKFDAEDVVYSYNAVYGDPGDEPDENGVMPWLVKPVEAIDEHTVVVTYNQPQYQQDLPLSLYYGILPEHVYSQVDRASYQDRDPIGTGPGRLKSFSPQQIVIEMRDDYWGEISPDLKEVHIIPKGTPGNLESQVTKGDMDWVQSAHPGVVGSFIPQEEHNGYYFHPDGSTRSIILSFEHMPTSDPAVRSALRSSVDMAIVAESAGTGYTVPSITGLDTTIYAEMLKDEFKEPMTPDIEAAKKSLEDAGWTVNDAGNLEKDGQEYPLKLHIQNDNAAEMSTMPLVVDQWKTNLGISVAFTPLPPEVFGPGQAKGDFPVSLWTTNASGGVFQAFTMYMHSKIYDMGDEKADGNSGRWRMPDEANDAIMAITTTPSDDLEALTTLCQTLQQAVADDAPYIPVQSNGVGSLFTTKQWSGIAAPGDIDYYPRVDTYNNFVQTLADYTPSTS